MRCTTVCISLLLAGCASTEEPLATLCEVEIAILHSPYLQTFSQSVSEAGASTFNCQLWTQGLDVPEAVLLQHIEFECRSFISEAMTSATACTGVTFKPGATQVHLSATRGAGANGPYVGLKGVAQRSTP